MRDPDLLLRGLPDLGSYSQALASDVRMLAGPLRGMTLTFEDNGCRALENQYMIISRSVVRQE
jgi:hypothetical protein